jgi:hypothetical protein
VSSSRLVTIATRRSGPTRRAASLHLALEDREEAARRRDHADAVALELARRVDERPEERGVGGADHAPRLRALHDPVAHRERPGPRVADVTGRARKACVEHEDADRDAVHGPTAAQDHAAV